MLRLTLLAALLAGCGGAPSVPADPLADVTVPPVPDWSDRYAEHNKGDRRFFNMSTLMQSHGLDRTAAVALQNHYRDLSRAGGTPKANFEEALARVKRGDFESGLDAKRLAAARFIVVFDLDDTLYDQYRTSEGCHDLRFERPGKSPKFIQLTPGWAETFERIRAAGGEVALFSANVDDTTILNARHWMWKGKPVLGHPELLGLLTNSHLVVQETTEGRGAKKRSKGQPVVEPSKDLRVFDESLERVIIVDDNPLRLFQLANTRLFRKFHAPAWCAGDALAKKAHGGQLAQIVQEIEESAAYAAREKVPFSRAYLPYTMLGQTALRFLVDSGLELEAAVERVRTNKKASDARF